METTTHCGIAVPPTGGSALMRLKGHLLDPVTGGFVVGTVALLLSVLLINMTVPLMGQEVQSSMYVCSVLGSYSIGSPVTWYCLRQNKNLSRVLGELEELHQLLKIRSRRDPMTGLLNREAFLKAADEAAMEDVPCAMFIGDIDRFKTINDTWGHLAGDQAIELVGGVFTSVIGESGIAGRIGGEEFAVLLTGENAAQASDLADAVRLGVAALSFTPVEGVGQPLSISIGGAFGRKGSLATDIVRRADRCLYKAKDDGRNKTVFDAAAA